MNKPKNLFFGLMFLAVSAAVIFFSNLPVLPFPTQEGNSCGEAGSASLTQGYLYSQEFTADKDWLVAIDLGIVSMHARRLSDNILSVLDANSRTLYTGHFTVENIATLKYQLFAFPEKLHVGKGNKVMICLSTADGAKDDGVVLMGKPDGKIGGLSVRPVINNDASATMQSGGPVFPMNGNLCVRTYESNSGFFNWSKIALFLAALFTASLIVFAAGLKQFASGLKFAPEKIYAVLALVFGLALAFVNPPLQSPDENYHFYRSYQISELNIFQYDPTVPTSLVALTDVFKRMNFMPYAKTSLNEILAQRKVALNPSVRSELSVPEYIFPHVPQALGIFIGRQFDASPVTLLYIGRIFNLLFSIFLIYLAIQTAPFFKWVFFLLGLMPMTLFLCSSLAKDGMIFGLSFLLAALFLRCAYGAADKVSGRDLAGIFVLSFLVTASRSVYFVLAGLYFLIPVSRIGPLKKYAAVSVCLALAVLLGARIWSLKPLFRFAYTPHAYSQTPAAPPPAPTDEQKKIDPTLSPVGTDAAAQKRFILSDPLRYLGILSNTVFIHNRGVYLDSFVGRFGWMNKHLPAWHIDLYLLALLLTALLSSVPGIKTGIKDRLLPLALFSSGIAIVETGMYLYWTGTGKEYVFGVQGRYFIPYAPLFFLFLYNQTAEKILRRMLPSGDAKPVKAKGRAVVKSAAAAGGAGPEAANNFGYCLLVCFSIISLISAVYAALSSNYRILL